MIRIILNKKYSFNSLPNDKILYYSKFKAFADDKINNSQKLKCVMEGVENIAGKGENVGHQHFILFAQCFNPFPNKPWFLHVCSTSF